ncbi:conserved Plasmodium protein, unknown function [Plasmodium malariae]|uniref:Uncharacterized protein n=1 Tax=Plasmodium malariae TaxID=5858 RepID=A0A1C3L0Y8_PLAMA|nr:conserved Plasmodium protein, unknown function [Plasmodium malariae]
MFDFYPLRLFFNSFRYENLPKKLIENIIKTGTFCRTMLPVFIPISIYQYIRQVRTEKKNVETLLQLEMLISSNIMNERTGVGAEASVCIDKDRYAEELFYEYAKNENLKSFYDSSMKNRYTKNWKIQYDLYLIDKSVNS